VHYASALQPNETIYFHVQGAKSSSENVLVDCLVNKLHAAKS